MKSFYIVFVLLLSTLPDAMATPMSCPTLETAVQVGVCPTDEQLRYTFTGYCSDDAKAYKGETDVCTDFERYKTMKNVVLWESADGAFDAYVSCELPKQLLQRAKLSGVRVNKQGKQSQLVCSYAGDVNFTHRTRAECKVEDVANCAASPESCKVSCN